MCTARACASSAGAYGSAKRRTTNWPCGRFRAVFRAFQADTVRALA